MRILRMLGRAALRVAAIPFAVVVALLIAVAAAVVALLDRFGLVDWTKGEPPPTHPFMQGYQAWQYGLDITDCPYRPGSRRSEQWSAGWLDGQRETDERDTSC